MKNGFTLFPSNKAQLKISSRHSQNSLRPLQEVKASSKKFMNSTNNSGWPGDSRLNMNLSPLAA